MKANSSILRRGQGHDRNAVYSHLLRTCSRRSFVRSSTVAQHADNLNPKADPVAHSALRTIEQSHKPFQHRQKPKKTNTALSGGSKKTSVNAYAKRLSVSIDGQPEQFDNVFLRDACTCPRCVDVSSQQKLFQTADIPADITAQHLSQAANGAIHIQWAHDAPGYNHHTSVFPLDFLRTYCRPRRRVRSRFNDQRQVLWDRATMEADVRSVDYEAYMTREESVLEALQQLSRYGLVFLHNVPAAESSVAEIGERIGPLRDSFYGRTWDVRSVPAAKNVAYTAQHLGHHMDLLYMAEPPTLQLLHCVRNRAGGGASLFADSFRAAAHLRLASPMLFSALATFPVTYHYRNDAQHYHHTHPTLVLDPAATAAPGQLAAVNYSPPFQGPFEADIGSEDQGARLRQYLAAAKAFARLVEGDAAVYERRMAEGECVVFHNRRVLHARRAFEPGSGDRWLRGAYVDGDAFWSRLRVLSENAGVKKAAGDMDGVYFGGDEHI